MPTVSDGGERVSSTAVREALARGDLRTRARAARAALQHQRAGGARRQARARARFPTANVQLKHNRPPLGGIFAVRVHGIDARAATGRGQPRRAADGARGRRPVLEVHLFDFTGDLYGAHLRVEFLRSCATRRNTPTSTR